MIHINSFVKRQTPESEFSHYEGSWEDLQEEIRKEMTLGKTSPGYREGVLLVHCSPERFKTSLVQLQEGDELEGLFKARRKGETPRKSIGACYGDKTQAKEAYVVLYASTVLAEGEDNELPAEEGNWEVISINASPVVGEMPIDPMTLMHNHFGSDGGTETNLSDSEFVAMLREGFEFWKDKALLAPKR